MRDPESERLSMRILVADDDGDSRFITSLLLSRAGYLVDETADGEDAWEALLTNRYDLLVTDHNMPRLCGLDLVARLRAAGMNLPVVLHSGWPGLGEGADYSNLRLAAVICKSANFNEVRDAVNRILARRAQDGVSRQGEFRLASQQPSVNPWIQPVIPAPCKSLFPNLSC